MPISCSARKDAIYHIKDWIDFERSHAKIHSNFHFDYDDIDYAFGQVDGLTTLWGGRTATQVSITRMDVYWLYDHGIGLKLTLSSKNFNDQAYKESFDILKQHHIKGNAIITSSDEFAKRIKNDFPNYQTEASAIQDIADNTKLEKKVGLGCYDTIVLPIKMNDDIKFLESIKDKKQIRLFLNAECSYTCPKKICYGHISKINKGLPSSTNLVTGPLGAVTVTEKGLSTKEFQELVRGQCSFYDLKMPRTFYNDKINWSNFYFDKDKFDAMGFEKYKLVPSVEKQQRTHLMYKRNFDSYVGKQ